MKYQRTGYVIQDRFKSESVEDDRYLLTVARYVHLNPVKAEMVTKPEEYLCSCKVYYGCPEYPPGLTHVSLVLDIFADQKLILLQKPRYHQVSTGWFARFLKVAPGHSSRNTSKLKNLNH
jgi:hypothetical protein